MSIYENSKHIDHCLEFADTKMNQLVELLADLRTKVQRGVAIDRQQYANLEATISDVQGCLRPLVDHVDPAADSGRSPGGIDVQEYADEIIRAFVGDKYLDPALLEDEDTEKCYADYTETGGYTNTVRFVFRVPQTLISEYRSDLIEKLTEDLPLALDVDEYKDCMEQKLDETDHEWDVE